MPITPVDAGLNSPQYKLTPFNVTITVDTAPTVNTTLQLYCTDTSLVTSSTGGAFPTSFTVLAGHTTAVIALKTGSPSTATNVTIAAGQSGTDMSNSANWQASKVLEVLSTSPPG